jgi:hypothetical protein
MIIEDRLAHHLVIFLMEGTSITVSPVTQLTVKENSFQRTEMRLD